MFPFWRRVPWLQRVFWQRDQARDDCALACHERDMALHELRDAVSLIDAAAFPGQRDRPLGACQDAAPTWNFPHGMMLTAAPQRYTDNYRKYVAAGGQYEYSDIESYEPGVARRALDKTRFYTFCLALDLIKKESVPGDLAELGVGKGHSASVLGLWANRLSRRLYLLDTFEGFPVADLVGADSQHGVQYADVALGTLRQQIPGRHVHFIKGRFPETADQIPDAARFCLVHLDCDLYQPFASALRFFWPRLADGGFLIMHDYSSLYWDGVETAVDEFFKDKPECVVPVPDMAGTAIVRKNKLAG
jgi:O-methyltransferase